MTALVASTAFFVALHLLVAGTSLRGRLVARLGEGPYMGLFSVLSFVGISLIVRSYRSAPFLLLWGEATWLEPLALVLTLPATVLAVVGLATPSPTAVGGGAILSAAEPAKGVLRITRHPFLWGVAIWAAVHLLLNGDAASLVLFGGFLFVAVEGTRSIDAKRRRAFGEAWDRFASVTSSVPFAAIASGRNSLRLGEIGAARLGAGVVVWALLLAVHEWIFGASPFPG